LVSYSLFKEFFPDELPPQVNFTLFLPFFIFALPEGVLLFLPSFGLQLLSVVGDFQFFLVFFSLTPLLYKLFIMTSFQEFLFSVCLFFPTLHPPFYTPHPLIKCPKSHLTPSLQFSPSPLPDFDLSSIEVFDQALSQSLTFPPPSCHFNFFFFSPPTFPLQLCPHLAFFK